MLVDQLTCRVAPYLQADLLQRASFQLGHLELRKGRSAVTRHEVKSDPRRHTASPATPLLQTRPRFWANVWVEGGGRTYPGTAKGG